MQRLTLPKYQHFTFSSFTIVSKLNPLKPNSSNYYTSLYKPNLHFFWHSGKWLQASQGNAATHVRCGGTNMVLLVIYRSLQQRKNFANWSRIDKVMAMVTVAHFLTRGVVAEYRWCFKRTLYQRARVSLKNVINILDPDRVVYRVGPKNRTVFWQFVTPVYVDIQ